MSPEQIRQLILANPQLRAKVESGDDQAVADALSLLADPIPTGELVTERSMFAALGPVLSETILHKLEQFAAGTSEMAPVVARGLRWMAPANGGLDFQHPGVVALLSGLAQAEVLTAAELESLRLLGTAPGAVSVAEVGAAVAVWRPNGMIQPISE